jgi:hypothetical protein
VLGSEGSSRTTGVLNAWEREEGVLCVVLAWKVMVSRFRVTFDTRDSSIRAGLVRGGCQASVGTACAPEGAVSRTIAQLWCWPAQAISAKSATAPPAITTAAIW